MAFTEQDKYKPRGRPDRDTETEYKAFFLYFNHHLKDEE